MRATHIAGCLLVLSLVAVIVAQGAEEAIANARAEFERARSEQSRSRGARSLDDIASDDILCKACSEVQKQVREELEKNPSSDLENFINGDLCTRSSSLHSVCNVVVDTRKDDIIKAVKANKEDNFCTALELCETRTDLQPHERIQRSSERLRNLYSTMAEQRRSRHRMDAERNFGGAGLNDARMEERRRQMDERRAEMEKRREEREAMLKERMGRMNAGGLGNADLENSLREHLNRFEDPAVTANMKKEELEERLNKVLAEGRPPRDRPMRPGRDMPPRPDIPGMPPRFDGMPGGMPGDVPRDPAAEAAARARQPPVPEFDAPAEPAASDAAEEAPRGSAAREDKREEAKRDARDRRPGAGNEPRRGTTAQSGKPRTKKTSN